MTDLQNLNLLREDSGVLIEAKLATGEEFQLSFTESVLELSVGGVCRRVPYDQISRPGIYLQLTRHPRRKPSRWRDAVLSVADTLFFGVYHSLHDDGLHLLHLEAGGGIGGIYALRPDYRDGRYDKGFEAVTYALEEVSRLGSLSRLGSQPTSSNFLMLIDDSIQRREGRRKVQARVREFAALST